MIDVEVNVEALAEFLGPVAARSKGGRSTEAGGRVVVRALRI